MDTVTAEAPAAPARARHLPGPAVEVQWNGETYPSRGAFIRSLAAQHGLTVGKTERLLAKYQWNIASALAALGVPAVAESPPAPEPSPIIEPVPIAEPEPPAIRWGERTFPTRLDLHRHIAVEFGVSVSTVQARDRKYNGSVEAVIASLTDTSAKIAPSFSLVGEALEAEFSALRRDVNHLTDLVLRVLVALDQ